MALGHLVLHPLVNSICFLEQDLCHPLMTALEQTDTLQYHENEAHLLTLEDHSESEFKLVICLSFHCWINRLCILSQWPSASPYISCLTLPIHLSLFFVAGYFGEWSTDALQFFKHIKIQ